MIEVRCDEPGQEGLAQALNEVVVEYLGAAKLHGPMRSAHEGLAVIREEYLELEAEVFRRRQERAALRREAVQLAAMAVRLLVDVLGGGSGEP